MIEGKTLSTFRDIVIIVGMLVLCFEGMLDVTARMQAHREQAARFAIARSAVARLDEAYKQMVANKSINEQFFRQNEVLIEYQKLILTLAYLPAPVAAPAPGTAPATAPPAAAPPAAKPPAAVPPSEKR